MIKLKSILTESAITPALAKFIKSWENNKDYAPGGWNKEKKRWFQHPSPEGGNPTIAFGHKLTNSDMSSNRFANGLTDQEAESLLQHDLINAENTARRLIANYDSLPVPAKHGLINACYRGELGKSKTPDTLKLMNSGDWKNAATEYLDYNEYKVSPADSNVRRRMEWNANQFKKVASLIKQKQSGKTTSSNEMIGKVLYPRNTSTHNYATIRTSPEVNTGLINNEQDKVVWPNVIGIVDGVTRVDMNTWYHVRLASGVGNGTGAGWVRYDVVTTDKNSKYQ